jgi:hypothetical protein
MTTEFTSVSGFEKAFGARVQVASVIYTWAQKAAFCSHACT